MDPSTIDTDARRSEWLAQRQKSIGGSEVGAILGLDPYMDPIRLWAIKSGLMEPDDLSDNIAVWYGQHDEPVIAKRLELESGITVALPDDRYEIRQRADHDYLHATLDGNVWSPHRPTPAIGVLEMKSLNAMGLAKADADGPPHQYLAQLQHGMFVTRRSWGVLACRYGNQAFRWWEVEYDAEWYEGDILPALRQFWHHVTTGTQPEPIGAATEGETLGAMYPREDEGDEPILLDIDPGLGDEYDDIQRQIGELKKRQDAIKSVVKSKLGASAKGLLSDSSGWSWKTTRRAEHVVKASESRVLRRIKRKAT